MNQSTSKLLGYRLATPVAKGSLVAGGYDAEKQLWVARTTTPVAGGTTFIVETISYLGQTEGDWIDTPPTPDMPEGGDQERFVEDDYSVDWTYGSDC